MEDYLNSFMFLFK